MRPIEERIRDGPAKSEFSPLPVLSIRNTDSKRSITLRNVDYFNSEGATLQSYLEQSMVLGPLASIDFFVDSTGGGAGANFIVNRDAEEEV